MSKKAVLLGMGLVVALIAGVFGYERFVAPTRVAFINFMDFHIDHFMKVDDSAFISIDRLAYRGDEFPDIGGYDVVFLYAHGNVNLNDAQRETIRQATADGMKIVFVAPSATENLSSVTEEEREFVQTCFQNPGARNCRSILNHARSVLDGKPLFSGDVLEPFVFPSDYYYGFGDDDIFESLAEYEAYYERSGRTTVGGPKVVMLSSIIGLDSGTGFLEPLAESLEAEGLNVYPVSARRKRIELAEAVKPDLMVYVSHGRLSRDQGVAFLERANIPMLCPIVVFAPYDDWMANQRGIDGGMLGQDIVLPELDGGTAPFTIAAQFENERGLQVFNGLRARIARFAQLSRRWTELKRKPNDEKRVAIFYYKGAGKNALVAEGLEVVPSLFNLLQRLTAEGYDTGDLPDTAAGLEERIQREGPVLGTYAQGSFEEFVADAEPALVEASTFRGWIDDYIEPEQVAELERDYGPIPGTHMRVARDGRAHVAISRVDLGNVTILPVPAAAGGDNADATEFVHGVKQPPPYPYIGAYLWAREGFGADALMHFGTHGSVEFTPSKQVALSDNDWPDALTGGIPHVYVYSISNIGEALIAKRRTYAVMNTHITPPMMQGEVYGDIEALDDALESYHTATDPLLKTEHKKTVLGLIEKTGLGDDLEIQDALEDNALTDDKLMYVHHYLHDIEQAKVTRGLHVLGRAYSKQEAYETLEQMAIDPLAFNLAQMDLLKGRATQEQVDDAHYFEDHYRFPAIEKIGKIAREGAAPESFLSEEDRALLAADDATGRDGTAPSDAE